MDIRIIVCIRSPSVFVYIRSRNFFVILALFRDQTGTGNYLGNYRSFGGAFSRTRCDEAPRTLVVPTRMTPTVVAARVPP